MGGFTAQFVVALTVTISLALVSGCLGTAFGLFMAISKGTAQPRLNSVVTAYTTVVRGVPELLIILLIYFGGTTLASKIAGRYVEVNAFTAGVIALSVVSAVMPPKCFAARLRQCQRVKPKRQSHLG